MEAEIRSASGYTVWELQKKLKDLLKITHDKAPVHDKESLKNLYRSWITEEYKEFMAEPNGTPEAYKEAMDLLWVIIQYMNCENFSVGAGFDELFREYNSKLYDDDGNFIATYRESDGKLLKGDNFKKADFKKIWKLYNT